MGRGLDWVTHRGPFQPRPFWDSVISAVGCSQISPVNSNHLSSLLGAGQTRRCACLSGMSTRVPLRHGSQKPSEALQKLVSPSPTARIRSLLYAARLGMLFSPQESCCREMADAVAPASRTPARTIAVTKPRAGSTHRASCVTAAHNNQAVLLLSRHGHRAARHAHPAAVRPPRHRASRGSRAAVGRGNSPAEQSTHWAPSQSQGRELGAWVPRPCCHQRWVSSSSGV